MLAVFVICPFIFSSEIIFHAFCIFHLCFFYFYLIINIYHKTPLSVSLPLSLSLSVCLPVCLSVSLSVSFLNTAFLLSLSSSDLFSIYLFIIVLFCLFYLLFSVFFFIAIPYYLSFTYSLYYSSFITFFRCLLLKWCVVITLKYDMRMHGLLHIRQSEIKSLLISQKLVIVNYTILTNIQLEHTH